MPLLTAAGAFGMGRRHWSSHQHCLRSISFWPILRSSTSSLLDIRPSRLVTVGNHSFAAAGPRLWNSLPVDVQSVQSLTTFRRKLETRLFRQSYPDIVFFDC